MNINEILTLLTVKYDFRVTDKEYFTVYFVHSAGSVWAWGIELESICVLAGSIVMPSQYETPNAMHAVNRLQEYCQPINRFEPEPPETQPKFKRKRKDGVK